MGVAASLSMGTQRRKGSSQGVDSSELANPSVKSAKRDSKILKKTSRDRDKTLEERGRYLIAALRKGAGGPRNGEGDAAELSTRVH